MKVFICYSRSDREPFVERLAADLRARHYRVWFDQWEIKGGDSLVSKIEKGITEATIFLIVLSPDSISSKWCKKKLSIATIIELEGESKFIVPLLLKTCEIPPGLKEKKYIDFRHGYNHGLQQLVVGLPLISYKRLLLTCPYCTNITAHVVRIVKDPDRIEHMPINCGCGSRFFLHVTTEGYYVTRSDGSDYFIHPTDGLNIQGATRWCLKKEDNTWVRPEYIKDIIKLMMQSEIELESNQATLKPATLLKAMTSRQDFDLYKTSRQAVRNFISVLIRYRYFTFSDRSSIHPRRAFNSQYINKFSMDRVLYHYLYGCLAVLKKYNVTHSTDEVSVVTDFLLEGPFENGRQHGLKAWEDIVANH